LSIFLDSAPKQSNFKVSFFPQFAVTQSPLEKSLRFASAIFLYKGARISSNAIVPSQVDDGQRQPLGFWTGMQDQNSAIAQPTIIMDRGTPLEKEASHETARCVQPKSAENPNEWRQVKTGRDSR
jgi:hypothetical protein